MKYSDYATGKYTFNSFNFNSTADVESINATAKSEEKPQYVFIACFEKSTETAYAVFNASSNGIIGNYGSEYINKIIIPGKAASGINKTVIPLPSISPTYETKNVLIGYVDDNGNAYQNSGEDRSTYGTAGSVQIFNANVVQYKYTITFYNGSEVNGIFYYSGESNTSNNSITSGLVAFSYNGTTYAFGDSSESATKAFDNILYPAKDGHSLTQWKDVDGNVMLDKVKKEALSADEPKIVVKYDVEFKKISSDMNFYANFEAKEYTIIYSGNTATATNSMKQFVKVGETVNLFSDSTFSNDGYKLKEWNTRPDGNGQTYALGSSFTLSGEQYEELNSAPTGNGLPTDYEKGFTLYAIWESVGGSGSGSGGNTGGDDDNMNTYILIAILIVIIIMIIVVAYLLRNKN